MSDYSDLKKRLHTMAATRWNPIGNEAKESIETLKHQVLAPPQAALAANEECGEFVLAGTLDGLKQNMVVRIQNEQHE